MNIFKNPMIIPPKSVDTATVARMISVILGSLMFKVPLMKLRIAAVDGVSTSKVRGNV